MCVCLCVCDGTSAYMHGHVRVRVRTCGRPSSESMPTERALGRFRRGTAHPVGWETHNALVSSFVHATPAGQRLITVDVRKPS